MTPPALAPERSPRVAQIVAAARVVLERDGADGLTMQSVAEELRIRAPSLYKHLAGKDAIRGELVVDALAEIGAVLHRSVGARDGDGADADATGTAGGRADLDAAGVARDADAVARLLAAYRHHALSHPALYRLATAGPLPRHRLPDGLEDWAGAPFLAVTRDEHRARALWSFAHGMVVLELDDRYPPGCDLDAAWAEGAAAFAAR